jgi:proteasome lid subunit RPN8/RPN11
VSDRIELDPKIAPRRMPSDVLQEICRHALEVVPEECCGFVIGDDREPFSRIVRISNIMTKRHLEDPKAFPRDARFAYYMAETEYQRALEEADARSERVNAIYHSHVDEDCYLSADDLAFAVHPLYPLPEASQIVVSVLAERIKTMGFFERIDGEGTPFRGRLLEATT